MSFVGCVSFHGDVPVKTGIGLEKGTNKHFFLLCDNACFFKILICGSVAGALIRVPSLMSNRLPNRDPWARFEAWR